VPHLTHALQSAGYLISDHKYDDELPENSRRSLVLEGGPMNPTERAAFEREEFNSEALQLRIS
jgi:predicted HD phosphohydrolase